MDYSDQLKYVIDALMDIKSILDRRRHIMYLQFTNIIEIYRTSKCYVPTLLCPCFSNGYLNFNFDYYHYIFEVRYILFNIESGVQSQPSMSSFN